MSLNIELSSVWRLWPLVTWDWCYYRWEFCDFCRENGHEMRREITVRLALPFATLIMRPGLKFKTWVAVHGCPNKRLAKTVAA